MEMYENKREYNGPFCYLKKSDSSNDAREKENKEKSFRRCLSWTFYLNRWRQNTISFERNFQALAMYA